MVAGALFAGGPLTGDPVTADRLGDEPLGSEASARGAVSDALAPAAMPIHRFELPNGLDFILVERQSSSNVAAGWVVRSGSADDPAAAPGVAHLLEHLLFKGTRTVGTRDFALEAPLLEELDRLRAELARLRHNGPESRERADSKGEEIRRRLAEIDHELSRVQVSGELSLLYSEAGAGAATGRTFEDFSIFSVEIPAEALELWFWLESDRLLDPVVRRLDDEVEIIAEERRQRQAAEPGAAFDDTVRAALWGDDHPYGRSILGTTEDLSRLSRGELSTELERRYRPGAITAVLVGRFDRRTVERWAHTYFGRLPLRARPSQGIAGQTATPRENASFPGPTTRLELSCTGCSPRIEVAYRTPAIGAADVAALELVAGLLNGRAGRLYRSWVLERAIADSAFVVQHPRRLAGSFRLHAEAPSGVALASLETAWRTLVDELVAQPASVDELDRLRARVARESLERLKEPRQLASHLLIHSALAQPARPADWAARLAAVSAEQIQAAVERHLAKPPAVVVHYGPTAPGAATENR